MKFQDSSFNGLKVTVGTKRVTHAPSKSNMPHQLFQSWGHNQKFISYFMHEKGVYTVKDRSDGLTVSA